MSKEQFLDHLVEGGWRLEREEAEDGGEKVTAIIHSCGDMPGDKWVYWYNSENELIHDENYAFDPDTWAWVRVA